ncbi:hypothetical protein [Vibrio jasicida]|uniref:hypothetical protein n=1 Tax=Vibrio jasicida TaxID=766224 RepID=UPI0007AF9A58|nr:hypothetical protein [Vibrio jasicida]
MLMKSTSTICFLLSALMAFMLSSGVARAEVSPGYSDNTPNAEVMHFSYCDIEFNSVNKEEPGCCEPGGTCFEKQCCTHGHASGTAVVETQQRSYEAPYRHELATSQTSIYTSADMHSHYRPPIA